MEFALLYGDIEQQEIAAELQHRNDVITDWMIHDLLSQPIADEMAEELQEQHEMSNFGRLLLSQVVY